MWCNSTTKKIFHALTILTQKTSNMEIALFLQCILNQGPYFLERYFYRSIVKFKLGHTIHIQMLISLVFLFHKEQCAWLTIMCNTLCYRNKQSISKCGFIFLWTILEYTCSELIYSPLRHIWLILHINRTFG